MTNDTDDPTNDRTEDESPDRSKPRSDREEPGGETGSRDGQPNSESSTGTETNRRRGTRGSPSTDRRPIEYVYWGGLIVFSILAVVALFNFYSNATEAISMWVAAKYEPIVQSAFALVVLLAALVGVSLTVRELSPSGGAGWRRSGK
ncbi:MAG: hypothetical protein ACI9YT_003121 [Halobacteriales archaeon]|jgi:hypothetical protein